ncbi:MAG TPA: MBL fold metallo-hydrolase [Patescibacteria group bacterium]|nr:MBL fold metallo-hydrolase [Patescibacteria group bacterium]
MKLTFFGAAQNVTGSKHLVETQAGSFLFDCGLHQGKRKEAEYLNKHFPINAAMLDSVLLSHAHADHCGMLPVLVRSGFKGKIYATGATTDIAKYILEDSAKIQEQDCDFLTRHIPEKGPYTPLYTVEDVEKTLPFFSPTPYFSISKSWTPLQADVRFKFYDAGHILGSATTLVEIHEGQETKTILYSGDLGHSPAPLLRNPELIEEQVDTLILEATYGNRLHDPVQVAENKLADIVNEAIEKKSKIFVPAFALGRTQEIIYILHKLHNENRIPHLKIFVDSPLSTSISEVFSKHTEDYDEETWQDFGSLGQVPLEFPGLEYVSSIEDSKKLNTMQGPFMVIAASGMMEGGRIRHHLAHNISDPNNYLLITGYQAIHTLGRKIHHGESPVKILEHWYDVRAKVITINEFSAHADRNQLLTFAQSLKGLKKIFLVHCEPREGESLKSLLISKMPGVEIVIPALKESYTI